MKTIKGLNKLITACMLVAISFTSAKAAVINVTSNILTNKTWFRGNTYILNGFIYVKNGATLTIQSGTIIKGDKASKGTLIITRGSQLIANGTVTQPIVFTSNQPVGSKAPGDWGGIIILGNAHVNTPSGTAIIEGGFTAPDGEYGGGGSPNDNESSGSLKYIRIEYPGIPFQPNNEINGITFGGVGRGTVVDHIQVSYSGDDAFEWFGGTVNAKWLVAYRSIDDDFDTDFGYNGKVQFAVGLRDPNIADASLSNGWESDNDATGSGNSPITQAWFSNVTIIGGNPTANANYNACARLRRNTQQSLYNCVMMGYPAGLHIDGSAAETNATNNLLQFQNNIIAGCATSLKVNSGSTFDISTYVNNQGGNNILTLNNDAMLTDPFNLATPNFMPQAGSPALSGASFSNVRLTDPFFASVSYRGAFGTDNWVSCWTEFNPQNETYSTNPINNAPVASITTGDPLTHCIGVNVTFNANTGAGLAYQWYKGTVIQSGQTGTTFTTALGGGGWKVLVTNVKGCTKYSNAFTTVVDAPTVSISNTNNLSLCVNNPVSLSASSATATGYQWQLNGINISGASSSAYNATAAGSYKVVVSSINGCTKLSSAKSVTANMPAMTTTVSSSICPPQTTQIAITNPVGGLSYQWQVNNGTWANISGATNTTYTVTSPASYRIRAFSSLGCNPKASATIVIGNSCRFEQNQSSSDISMNDAINATIYPNPFSNESVITFELANKSNVVINIYDVTGKLVSHVADGTFNEGVNEIKFSADQLITGLYFAKISVNGIDGRTIKLNVQRN